MKEQKRQTDMESQVWCVRHKNPNIPQTDYGKEWSYDGPFSEKEAMLHVMRCGFVAHNIPYEMVEVAYFDIDIGLEEEE